MPIQLNSVKSLLCGILLAGGLFSCTTEKEDRPVRPSDQVRLQLPGSAEERIKPVPDAGGSFFVRLHSRSAWTIQALEQPTTQARALKLVSASWVSLERSRGEAGENVRVAILVEKNLGAPRSAKLIISSAGISDTLTISQAGLGGILPQPTPTPTPTPVPQPQPTPQPTPTPTPTPTPVPQPQPPVVVPGGEHILGDASLLEVPALAGGAHNYFITYRANGVVNYSLEYDTQKRHPRFVCFSFDNVTSQTNVKRSEAWAWDAQIPRQYSTESLFKGSGYDRGHMVASSDRVFSLEANHQTFYYTNMSPQLGGLNQKFWQQLEHQVQTWGRSSSLRDVMYVAKGGTIRDNEVEARKVRNLIVVPKHYWMAMVVKKGSTYHGLAFYVEHKEYPKGTRFSSVAMSIDELEGRIGLDLFHNFPDDLEQKFEAEAPTSPAFLSSWPGL